MAWDWKRAVRECKSTDDVTVIVALTKHEDARVRKSALKEMCPCRVKQDISAFWERVLEMLEDEGNLYKP